MSQFICQLKQTDFLRSLKNKKFISQYEMLLKNSGIFASSCEKKNRNEKIQVSTIGRIKSTVKYFYYNGPYLVSYINYLRLSSLISQKQMLNSIKLSKEECNDLKRLLIKARDKVSNKTTKEKYILLSKILKEKYNLAVKEKTIEAWLFKGTGIPLSFIILSCKLTNTPFIKVLPNWVSGVLYLHDYITKEELEKIRKIKFPLTPHKSQVSEPLPSWIYSLDLSS